MLSYFPFTVPSVPRSVSVKSVDLDVVKVLWGSPAISNGVIGSYSVMSTAPFVETCTPESLDKTFCYFMNVAPNSKFEVKGRACTLPNDDGYGGGCSPNEIATLTTWAKSKFKFSVL